MAGKTAKKKIRQHRKSAIEWIKSGMTYQRVADKYNVSVGTVWYWVNKTTSE